MAKCLQNLSDFVKRGQIVGVFKGCGNLYFQGKNLKYDLSAEKNFLRQHWVSFFSLFFDTEHQESFIFKAILSFYCVVLIQRTLIALFFCQHECSPEQCI